MITLKDYQTRVLDSLRDFLRQAARDQDPDPAFREVTRRTFGVTMPYVCLRVPTGGGKTLLACSATGLVMREFMRAERAVVLWLVPSNTILDQTADALRDPRHPYRRELELACGAVEVVTIEEALRLSRATVEGQTVIIVATIQSFRVEDTTGRTTRGRSFPLPLWEMFGHRASSSSPQPRIGRKIRPMCCITFPRRS